MGWLGLGLRDDARAELEQISAANQSHPDVLEVRWELLAREELWAQALATAEKLVAGAPDRASGWLHQAYAARRVPGGGLEQAWAVLHPAAKRFPKEPTVFYNLACYACQLQRLAEAREWLRQAVAVGGREQIKRMALTDDDLAPLWPEIEKL